MANRRMLSKDVINTDRFMNLPVSSRCLYFHLVIEADDDGFVLNPRMVMLVSRTTEGDIKSLCESGHIIPFDSGVVVVTHWGMMNTISSDKYRPTVCVAEKAMLVRRGGKVYELVPESVEISTKLPEGFPEGDYWEPQYSVE